ncbi:cytochrome c [Ramlibacter sp. USB13]|uniref:Cytochrome c n=1 Tax=Ramlibacter cellulosilyticus TaxID=2764187 RepID=A0A923MQP3_9BURK|nr:cytochrome c [Ramlibacter cellulosilyticus]MBC5784052.1 cytochrome c [Ramlibacter cellulosilyticus]
MKCACVLLAVLALAGCERSMHDMYRQPRLDQGEASPLFPDGRGERPPPAGSVPVAAGTLAMTSSGRKGRELPLAWQVASERQALPAVTDTLLARGQERYGIYCLPCHGAVGDGDGPVVRRGFPHPPSYHEQRLRDAPDRHFHDVITNGYGIMHSYADRVPPQDRWAIVAYIRALQFSQQAPVAQLPPAVRAKLPGGGPAGGPR